MSNGLDLEYIKGVIQQILDARFPEGERRRIETTYKDFAFACPVCGDSARDVHQKRGHLYHNSMMYKCYNDGCKSSFTALAKRHNVILDPEKKMAIINYVDANMVYRAGKGDDYVMSSLDKLIPLEELQKYFDTGTGFLSSFRPCRFGDAAYSYMVARGFPEQFVTEHLYTAIQHKGNGWKEPVVIFLNRVRDKILGMQIRNLKDDKRLRSFKIYNFEALYNEVYDEPIDETEAIGYNKLSYLFDVMNVDFENIVTIFEGYLDSRFFPNSIGAVGTNTDFNFLIQNELPIRFFFDNDNTGNKKAMEYMKMGYSVFLWEKLFQDCAKKRGDYHQNLSILREIKDLNKLALAIANPYKALKLEDYFSKDMMDKHWIPKPEYKKRDFKAEQRKAVIEKHIDNGQWEELKKLVLNA